MLVMVMTLLMLQILLIMPVDDVGVVTLLMPMLMLRLLMPIIVMILVVMIIVLLLVLFFVIVMMVVMLMMMMVMVIMVMITMMTAMTTITMMTMPTVVVSLTATFGHRFALFCSPFQFCSLADIFVTTARMLVICSFFAFLLFVYYFLLFWVCYFFIVRAHIVFVEFISCRTHACLFSCGDVCRPSLRAFRAETMVDGLPRAPKFVRLGVKLDDLL